MPAPTPPGGDDNIPMARPAPKRKATGSGAKAGAVAGGKKKTLPREIPEKITETDRRIPEKPKGKPSALGKKLVSEPRAKPVNPESTSPEPPKSARPEELQIDAPPVEDDEDIEKSRELEEKTASKEEEENWDDAVDDGSEDTGETGEDDSEDPWGDEDFAIPVALKKKLREEEE